MSNNLENERTLSANANKMYPMDLAPQKITIVKGVSNADMKMAHAGAGQQKTTTTSQIVGHTGPISLMRPSAQIITSSVTSQPQMIIRGSPMLQVTQIVSQSSQVHGPNTQIISQSQLIGPGGQIVSPATQIISQGTQLSAQLSCGSNNSGPSNQGTQSSGNQTVHNVGGQLVSNSGNLVVNSTVRTLPPGVRVLPPLPQHNKSLANVSVSNNVSGLSSGVVVSKGLTSHVPRGLAAGASLAVPRASARAITPVSQTMPMTSLNSAWAGAGRMVRGAVVYSARAPRLPLGPGVPAVPLSSSSHTQPTSLAPGSVPVPAHSPLPTVITVPSATVLTPSSVITGTVRGAGPRPNTPSGLGPRPLPLLQRNYQPAKVIGVGNALSMSNIGTRPPVGNSAPTQLYYEVPRGATSQTHSVATQSHGIGTQSHSIGTQSHSIGSQSHGIGAQSHGIVTHSHGIGTQPHGIVTQSHSIGTQSHSIGTQSHSIETQSHGIGSQAHGIGAQSHGIVTQSHGIGTQSHGIVTQSHGIGTQSHGIGMQTHGMGTQSHSHGIGMQSHVIGTQLHGIGTQSHGIARQTLGVVRSPRAMTLAPLTPAVAHHHISNNQVNLIGSVRLSQEDRTTPTSMATSVLPRPSILRKRDFEGSPTKPSSLGPTLNYGGPSPRREEPMQWEIEPSEHQTAQSSDRNLRSIGEQALRSLGDVTREQNIRYFDQNLRSEQNLRDNMRLGDSLRLESGILSCLEELRGGAESPGAGAAEPHGDGGSTTVSAASSPGPDDEMPSPPLPLPVPPAPVLQPEPLEISPRKKPRKQMLSSEVRQCDYDMGLPPSQPPPPPPVKPPPKRPQLSSSYVCGWRATALHFTRPSDVRRRPPRPTDMIAIATQRRSTDGWKLTHLTAQMDDAVSLESDVGEQLSSILRSLETAHGKGQATLAPKQHTLVELVKGNIQRSKIVCEGIQESREDILRVFKHQTFVGDILARQSEKRSFRKHRSQT